MGSLKIRGRRDEHSVARPTLINLKKRGIVLGNDKHFVLMLLAGNANQPVVKKRQGRLTAQTITVPFLATNEAAWASV
nr:hypothetical protein CFP56_69824 [Quercus suber]